MADQGTEGLLSPFLRTQRINAARPHLFGRVLDVGCGSGALAEVVEPKDYLGLEIDEASIAFAREKFPQHTFENTNDIPDGGFDTVVALAVIEHVPSPAEFLKDLSKALRPTSNARVICTTPHPSMDIVHTVGAKVGLFSQSANDEHEDLLDRKALDRAGQDAGLVLQTYRRFLYGANQIAIYVPDQSRSAIAA